MVSGNQIRPGMVIEYQGTPYQVMEAVHRTPGNKRAFMQTKLRNLVNGEQAEVRFSANDRVERLSLEERKMQFLYTEGGFYHFMDVENFEQIQMSDEQVGDATNFLLPETVISVTSHEGKTIGINLPKTMDFKVTETAPELKGATASAQYKPATLETGLQVKVPPFIAEGDKVRIDTESHEYVTRVTE
ncbi:MAG: elongation factor P [bacterium]|nr:elongation factor P [bacterium]